MVCTHAKLWFRLIELSENAFYECENQGIDHVSPQRRECNIMVLIVIGGSDLLAMCKSHEGKLPQFLRAITTCAASMGPAVK